MSGIIRGGFTVSKNL